MEETYCYALAIAATRPAYGDKSNHGIMAAYTWARNDAEALGAGYLISREHFPPTDGWTPVVEVLNISKCEEDRPAENSQTEESNSEIV